ncbi:MAG: class I adenylate-forming enzyme family protein [Acidimicrobiia bacterium]
MDAPAPDGPLLVDQLRFMAQQWPDEVAYRDLGSDGHVTFAEWEEQSNRAARWLMARGVTKGDRVGIYLPNEYCLRWIVAYAAVHKAGAVMVPANTRLSVPELVTILGHAEISAMFTCSGLLDSARAVTREVPSLRSLLCADGAEAEADGWDDATATLDPSAVQVALDADDMADIMYTSGTTGLPKGVLVRHRNVAMIPNGTPPWSGAGWLHGAPLFTFAGMSFIYNPMKLGLAGLYMPRFDVDHWFDVVEQDRPMMIFLVPAMAELVTASSRFETADLSAPITVSIGSAPLAPATLKRLQDRMPQATVSNSYGLTEAGPAYLVMPKEDLARKPGSVGKPMPPMEIRVVDPDTDEDKAPDAVGELLVRLPGKRREYYRDDGATASTWTDDGWLRTGDLAYVDDEGFVYISGRIKDMIIRGGNNIFATDVEAVLLEHAAVQEAAVIGVPHAVLGEDVGAFIVRKPDTTCSEAELQAFCSDRLADYKRPRHVWFVAELPRNATGKVMKHKLREQVGQ